MKKLMKFFGIVAVAAMSLTACQNEFDEQVNQNNGSVTIDITANAPATRSAFGDKDGDNYPSSWSGTETVYFAPYQPVSENLTMSEATPAAGAKAKFTVTFGSTVDNGSIYAFSPKGQRDVKGGFTSNQLYYDSNPPYIYTNVVAEQTTTATSCDEQAHILFGAYAYDGGFPTSVEMDFQHVLAYGKMTIKNFDKPINSVKVTFPVAVAGGSVKYYYTSNEFEGASESAITITNSDENNNVMWFGVVPATIADNTTIVITSGEDTYTKTLATAGKLDFQQGKVSNFAVDMNGVPADGEAPEGQEYVYTLVTDASTLAVGDKIVITGATNNIALSTTQNTNNRMGVEATIINNDLTITDDIQVIELKEGTASGQFGFYVGTGYLYAASSSKNYLRTNATLDANGSFSISITSNEATIKANGSNRPLMRYNPNSGNPIFACYAADSATGESLRVFKQTLQAADTRDEQTLTWTTPEQTLVVGFEDEFVVPRLEGAETTVNYETSDNTIATVDANGVVSLVLTDGLAKAGTVTITATAAESGEFQAAVAKATINIEKASINKPNNLAWEATDTTAKTITLTGNHLDKGVTIKVNEPTGYTVTVEGLVITVEPNAANETNEDVETTLSIRIVNGEDVTIGEGANVTLTQRGVSAANEDSVIFADLGLTDATALTTTEVGSSTITWAQESGNAPAYYTSDDTARVYNNNTITVASEKTISSIVINFKSSGYAKLKATGYTLNDSVGTWTGNANEVVFSVTGTSRITSITITYGEGGGVVTPDPEDPETPGTGEPETSVAIYTANFEGDTEHRTSGNNSYTSNTYNVSGVNWNLTFADAVTSGSPLDGSAHIIARVAKNTTNSPSIVTENLISTTSNISKVSFYASLGSNVTLKVYYSTNGTSWTELSHAKDTSIHASYGYSADVNLLGATGFYLKFEYTVSSSTGSNRDNKLDNVVIYN